MEEEANSKGFRVEVPVIGGPQEQGLAARAAVCGGVTAVHWWRYRVLLIACRQTTES